MILLVLISFGWWRGTAVGSQVQVPMFYDAHYLFPRAWTQEQAAPGVPQNAPLAFYGHNRVSQSFVSGANNLAMIEIWLAGEQDDVVELSLSSNRGQIYSGEQILSQGREGAYYRFTFPPISDAKGQEFLLTLSATGSTVENPVVTRTVGGDRLGGSLQLNEYNRPGNLVLHSYGRGLPGQWWLEAIGEQVLPDLFYLRLQQYKPDPFKGNFFGLVLLSTVVLSVAFLYLARPQQRPSLRTLQASLGWTVALLLGLFLIWQVGDGRVRLPIIHDSNVLSGGEEAIAVAAPPQSGMRLMRDIVSDLWTLDREPEARFLQTEIADGFPAVRVPGDSSISFNIDAAPQLFLKGGLLAEGQGSLLGDVIVNGESIYFDELAAGPNPGKADISWFDVDLSPWAGQPVTVEMRTVSDGQVEGIWIMPRIETSAPWLFEEPLPDLVDFIPRDVSFDGTVELVGSTVEEATVSGGDALNVDLYWRPLRSTEQYAKVFVHLLNSNGNLVAQSDNQPVQNAYPIPVWQQETVIRDSHTLALPPDLPAGEYTLLAGLYDMDSLRRWAATPANGASVINNGVVLQPLIEVIR